MKADLLGSLLVDLSAIELVDGWVVTKAAWMVDWTVAWWDEYTAAGSAWK
jgi:hypothetical protein